MKTILEPVSGFFDAHSRPFHPRCHADADQHPLLWVEANTAEQEDLIYPTLTAIRTKSDCV